MDELKALKDELDAGLLDDWHVIPITTASRHKWLLEWYRAGDGVFCIMFVSPKPHYRRYIYYIDGGRVIGVEIAGPDNGARLAWYAEAFGHTRDRLAAVSRLIPSHVQRRLQLLLDALNVDSQEV